MDDSIKNSDKTEYEERVHINTSVTPIYGDDIVQFNFDKGVAKILLAQRFQHELTHTSTVAVPLQTILSLKNLLNSEAFTKAAEEFMNNGKD